MKNHLLLAALVAASLLTGVVVPAEPQDSSQSATRQKTDGESPTIVGPGSQAYKQKTDGESPTIVGPGSKAYKQNTDGEAPTIVGPGSAAFKQLLHN